MKFLLAAFLLFVTSLSQAQQERSPFRRGYLRLGINTLGQPLDFDRAPLPNILESRYGAGTGAVFETGRVYYFNKPTMQKRVGYGLDWTIASLTFNPLNKWKAYAEKQNQPDAVEGPFAATLATRLGPVVSIRPVEKLVIDLRAQLVAAAHYYNYYYSTDDYSFSLENGIKEEDSGSFLNMVSFGFKPSFGMSIRRKVIGLAVDYAPGNILMNYEERRGDDYSYASAKIKTDNLQLKLSFTF